MLLTIPQAAVLWYVIGLIGAYGLWYVNYRDDYIRWLKNTQYAHMPATTPTPRAIAAMLIIAVFGVGAAIVAIVFNGITIIEMAEFRQSQGQRTFWLTPIGEWFK